MNINVLPKSIQFRASVETMPEHQPFSGDRKGWSAKLTDHVLYILSFFLPLLLLTPILYMKGIVPFGNINFFINSGSEELISVFLRFSSQLHDHTFSFLNASGAYDTTMGDIFFLYLSSPFTLLAALFPSGLSLYALSTFSLIRIALSGLMMFIYLTERKSSRPMSCYDIVALFFSTAYALSGCLVMGQLDYRFMDMAFLFPLLMLFFEKLTYEEKPLPFYILCTLLLYDNPSVTTLVLIILFLYLIISCKQNMKPHAILRFLTLCILCIGSALPAIVSTLDTIHVYAGELKAWPDFSFITDWYSFYTRLLPDSEPSTTFLDQSGANLYFSFFLLFLLTAALFQSGLGIRKRIERMIILGFLILCINTTTLNYILSPISFGKEPFSPICFIFVFCSVIISSEMIYHLKEMSFFTFCLSMLIPAALLFLTGAYADYPIDTSDYLIVILICLLYIVIYTLYRINSIKRALFLFISGCILFTELLINTECQMYHLSVEKTTLVNFTASLSSNDKLLSNPFEEYTLSLQDTDFFSTSFLPEYCFLPNNYSHPDLQDFPFETANAVYSSLGGSGQLFEPVNSDIEIRGPKRVLIRHAKDNVFIFDSRNYDNPFYFAALTITPPKSGELFMSSPDISYMGNAESNTAISTVQTFPVLTNHSSVLALKTAIFNQSGYTALTDKLRNSDIKISANPGSLHLSLDSETDQSLLLPINADIAKKISIKLDGTSIQGISGPAGHAVVAIPAGQHSLVIKLHALPILVLLALSIIVILLSLCILRKKAVTNTLANLDAAMQNTFSVIGTWCRAHAAALLSFAIPFLILMLASCIACYAPFGGSVFFKSDGAALTMPNMYATRAGLINRIREFPAVNESLTTFFQFSVSLLQNGWLLLVPSGSLIVLTTMVFCIKTAFSGFAMYAYLTNRLYGQRFSKEKLSLIAFTTAYAVSAYTLNFRQFYMWADIVALLPLILLSMDYLMYQKKIFAYILLLSYCIIFNTMNSIYLCAFLAMWFFIHRFDDFADLIKKGVLFAIASLWAGGCSYWILAGNVSSRSVSGYNSDDSIAPSLLKFYQSYFDSLKQIFIFSEPVCVTEKDGAINLYCSILCIVLFILLLYLGKNNKRKIGRILIAAFIFFSSNNDMMSYLWNGLHYQSKVPNRYSFILIFLLLDMALDGFSLLKNIKPAQALRTAAIILIFLGVVWAASFDSTSVSSKVFTLVFAVAYCLLILLTSMLSLQKRQILMTALCCFCLLELCLNACHIFKSDEYYDGTYVDQNMAVTDYLKDHYLTNPLDTRVTYNSSEPVNQGDVNQVQTLSRFGSSTSFYEISYASSMGYHDSVNNIMTTTNETPFTSAMINNGYFIVNSTLFNPCLDTDHYELISQYQNDLLFRNNRALPYGFYIPAKLFDDVQSLSSASDLANAFSNALAPGNDIFGSPVEFKESKTESDSNAICSFSENGGNSLLPYICHIQFTAPDDGEYYYRNGEYFYLGQLEKDQEYKFSFPVYDEDPGSLFRYNDGAFQAFYNESSRYALSVTSHTSSVLEGSITLPEDGYIILAYPYSDSYRATLNGTPSEVACFVNSALLIKADAGTYQLRLFSENQNNTIAIYITMAFWLMYIIAAISLSFIRKKKLLIPINN
ncbi:MAG: YfhO family protein [Lachnospiraceae bacterium]|nr:YfhO family protein [Lachnospiraceae bacterium]